MLKSGKYLSTVSLKTKLNVLWYFLISFILSFSFLFSILIPFCFTSFIKFLSSILVLISSFLIFLSLLLLISFNSISKLISSISLQVAEKVPKEDINATRPLGCNDETVKWFFTLFVSAVSTSVPWNFDHLAPFLEKNHTSNN